MERARGLARTGREVVEASGVRKRVDWAAWAHGRMTLRQIGEAMGGMNEPS